MGNRQSTEPDSVGREVDQIDREQTARYIGNKITERMRVLGWWNEKKDKPDVRRLQTEVAAIMGDSVRWQTAQFWIQGKSRPEPEHQGPIAEALGVTLEELVGVATGREPRWDGWRRFTSSDLGRTMTGAERQALASMLWPNGEPDESSYKMVLLAMRAV